MLLQIFDKGLDEISKIPDLEPKILSDLYKSQKNEMFIKAPMKPRDKPLEPTSFRQVFRILQVPDENKWIHDLNEKLKSALTEAIKPLSEYLQKFEKFKDVLLAGSAQVEGVLAVGHPERAEDLEPHLMMPPASCSPIGQQQV